MADISLLFGSGVSIPAGYPSVSDMNSRLSQIDASNITIHTDNSAWFIKEQSNQNNKVSRIKEREFIQKFINHYVTKILRRKDDFDYEAFYDYYQDLKATGNYTDDLNKLFSEFIEGEVTDADKNQILFEFNIYFNQLIQDLLFKNFKRVHLCEPYHPSCSVLLRLLGNLGQHYIVNIHTLNHDLYMEHLSISDSIGAELDDGFEEIGSSYYGELLNDQERYHVRLSRFTNNFSKKFRLFKLHGSIDNYWFSHDQGYDLIKLKHGISRHHIYKETNEETTKIYYPGNTEIFPDFLSGKYFKIKRSKDGPYYPRIFEHFEINLRNSNSLIIIGYGFKDDKINNHICRFLEDRSKKIFVVDIAKPNHKILKSNRVFFIEGGVVNMNYEYILKNVL